MEREREKKTTNKQTDWEKIFVEILFSTPGHDYFAKADKNTFIWFTK